MPLKGIVVVKSARPLFLDNVNVPLEKESPFAKVSVPTLPLSTNSSAFAEELTRTTLPP